MIKINDLPTDEKVRTETIYEILYQSGMPRGVPVPTYFWDGIRLAYKLGFNRANNLGFV